MLGLALNELFVPLLQRQYPEIVDFYLPPEGLKIECPISGWIAAPCPSDRYKRMGSSEQP